MTDAGNILHHPLRSGTRIILVADHDKTSKHVENNLKESIPIHGVSQGCLPLSARMAEHEDKQRLNKEAITGFSKQNLCRWLDQARNRSSTG